MSCVRSLLLVLFCCASLPADTVILEGGRAWYLADGQTVKGRPVDTLIRLGGDGPVDPPIDPPVDPPTDPTELEQLSSTWRTKVVIYDKRSAHRQGLMATYSVLATQIDAGSVTDLDELGDRSRAIRDLLLGGDKSKWAEWGADIQSYLNANVLSIDEAAPAYREIAAGLSVSGEAIDSGWIRLIEIILEALGEGVIPPIMLSLIKILLEILGG